ncbi:related to SMP3 - alpha 1,2-mannosyltransferase involved in glycosyl phosphatidyl inositol biosynthesis [Ustilago trichophora]|uniref:Mannosyltransferase n=1 Tax=Ustilago trichophora TaxID=86804 RepID=A0A5C3EKZ0_9BASI|nr:related to SMP3 - alpha 1,2-mannosyltransferase involved in glycosyl phosphatidyl inositol biosynthesis [Ustilago trichophora]
MPPNSSSKWSAFDPRTRWGKVYLALLLLRCYSAFFGYGYIHPDEWMQSGEAYFGFTLPGNDARIPWEWRPDQALRSFSSLRFQYIFVDFLLYLFKKFSVPLSGYNLFLIQRTCMLLWTLSLDAYILDLPPRTARYVFCLFNISTAATTFLVRPFSNSHEANIVATCLMSTLSFYRNRTWYRPSGPGWNYGILLPAILAVEGLFNRFTFAIFSLPIGIFIAYTHIRIAKEGYLKQAFTSFTIAMVIALAALYHTVESETKFYTRSANINGLEVAKFSGSNWVIPPVNALLYNVKTENVAQHGLHPRWLHGLVNLPMMVGIANCVVMVIYGWQFVRGLWTSSVVKSSTRDSPARSTDAGPSDLGRSKEEEEEEEQKEIEQAIEASLVESAVTTNSSASASAFAAPARARARATTISSPDTNTPNPSSATEIDIEYVDIEPVAVGLCLTIIVFSLAILSISPHQEPRFLLALAFPSTIIMAYALQSPFFKLRPYFVRTLILIHILQHILQLVVFSFLHQGGLLPTLFSIDRSMSLLPTYGDPLFTRYQHHLLYRTFSVPFHFLPHKGRHTFPRVQHYDSSTTPENLVRLASISCNHTAIYAPTWIVPRLENFASLQDTVTLVKSHTFAWHIDLDHLHQYWIGATYQRSNLSFAIQKLDVTCKVVSQHVSDFNHKMQAEKQQDPTLAHKEL